MNPETSQEFPVRTTNQKFPAEDRGPRIWERLIPIPSHIAKHLTDFAIYEKQCLISNYKHIIGRNNLFRKQQMTAPLGSGIDALGTESPEKERSTQFILKTKYKTVDRKVRPVPGVTPEDTKVTRRFPENPLKNLPTLPVNPPPFKPTLKITKERMESLGIDENEGLLPEERKLLRHIIALNERSIAFDENERGTFRQDYFSDYKIPYLEHEPWMDKNIPIPPGYRDEILNLLREKIDAGVYEPTQSSYRSKWFCVKKKDNKLRMVHDLQKLNSVTIRDTGVPPILDEFVESFAGKPIYSVLDMYWGFYARIMDPESRDLTAFQTPLGTLQIVSLPMGFTNSPAEFQACMMFILKEEVCNRKAGVFIDDVPINGPTTTYPDASGKPSTLTGNPGI